MDCLEFNIHQLVLSDLASNVGQSKTEPWDDIQPSVDLFTSKVATRATTENVERETQATEGTSPSRVFMSTSRLHCNIGFAELALTLRNEHLSTIVPVLTDILRDVPFIDFDECLVWEEWALPDQLVFATVSSLLHLARDYEEYRTTATDAIFAFIAQIVEKLQTESSSDVLTQYAPAFHGFYRAIISNSFPWSFTEWNTLSNHLNSLFAHELVDRLNRLIVDIISAEEGDPDRLFFAHTFLSRYVHRGRPLSGYFLVCCVIEAQWTVLAQVLTADASSSTPSNSTGTEAEAANKAWDSLMDHAALHVDAAQEAVREALLSTMEKAIQCFAALLVQIEEMESEPSIDSYAWETMSESLKLASVCSVAMSNLDQDLLARLKLLLSDKSPIFDNSVQEAALKATTILVMNFPDNAATMASHLRRFVTSPLPIFEFEFASESRSPPPLSAAAKCLALCIKLAPGDDLIMSNMYSLLNYIAATSKEINESSSASQIMAISNYVKPDQATLQSVENGLRGFSEDEKRLIGISTISVVAKLALEFQMEEVTRLTISMLLQRLRSAEPTVEAAIAFNLVELALSASESSFVDIIRVFSAINRSSNPDDPRFSNNMVLAAQTRLSQELHRRPEFFDIYLVELLSLFADKGVAIQNLAVSNNHVKVDDMVEQLASLLLPIDALLEQKDFKPHARASPELIALFRDMWFLCVLFHFTSGDDSEHTAMDWLRPALARISVKTPALVIEDAHGSVANDIEYNSVIRQEYANTVIAKHRALLTKYISLRASEIRHLLPGHIIFLLTMRDVEGMRSAAGYPSYLVSYFTNIGLNGNVNLSTCMESVAENVIRGCINDLSVQAAQQALPEVLTEESRSLLVQNTHRIEKARTLASKYTNRLLTSFPSLLCNVSFVHMTLEVLTLLQRACENEFTDEFNPVYEYRSERMGITLELTDNFRIRNDILVQLQRNVANWFNLALGRAPGELQSILQKYLALNQSLSVADSVELGASIAEQFGKAIDSSERQLASMAMLTGGDHDRAKMLASQLVSKVYFEGEAAGVRLASRIGHERLDKSPPETPPTREISALKDRLNKTLKAIRAKDSTLKVVELKRLLFRCGAALIALKEAEYDLLHLLVVIPFEVFTPSSVSVGVEVWTWVISEKAELEMAVMTEITSAWLSTINQGRGIFSFSLNADDPFYHPIDYAPTDKDVIDRGASAARRLLIPHILVLNLLSGRMQAAKYRKSGLMFLIQRLLLRSLRSHRSLSTHPLAREARFTLLLFGFETLKGSHLDSDCEYVMREGLYAAALSWFAVRPQWSYGSNRVQSDAEIRLLSEVLSYLETDAIRGSYHVSSLGSSHLASRISHYSTRLKNINQPLRLLVENEISRISVWANPCNDARRGSEHIGLNERTLTENAWTSIVRVAWQLDPAVAIYLTERFKGAALHAEVIRLVRSSTQDVLHVPNALPYLVGDGLERNIQRDFKYLLLWAPVTPVIAVTFFERRFHSDPVLLQYAHRVLEEHPVELTFFFVPQIVQALRYDDLGYVARFVFETAKISQLFCHQIIWNMKANCYKDDAAEVADPMKPILDEMTDKVVGSLSGEARSFYDREFGFFNEVTSISGKLRPFIKKTKPEKKAKIDEEMAKVQVQVGVYLPSNPDGTVIDIDRKSGRPLQSHAKAPFMATFKVRKERIVVESDPESLLDGDASRGEKRSEYDVWLQAIFKVGDDCRQDVLALQVIAMFKNIFTNVGLTLYLYPYRVTATAPGCGVIDVVPNATSRDEMGRAKVNDLLGFFISKYGGEDTVPFQRARLNFIQSMAAYSVACYILQIKDRHNGNIMIDGEGHIVHIDFGFLFDIDKWTLGIKFEPSSFKLTHEMVVLMGGRYSQGYELFQKLTVKAFLALRPHVEQLVGTVRLMLDTGLPSFKGDGTIKRLRDRFAPGLNERQAAEYMMGIVRNAHENVRSTAYDEFQRIQNGIPYA